MSRYNRERIMAEKFGSKQMYDTAVEEVEKARNEASHYILSELKRRGIPLSYAAAMCGVNPGGLTKRLQGRFSLPLDAVIDLCNGCLEESVHSVLFGESYSTRLPASFSLGLSSLMNYPSRDGKSTRTIYESEKHKVLEYAVSLRKKDISEGKSPTNTVKATCLNRFTQLADTKGVELIYLFGTNSSIALKQALRGLRQFPDREMSIRTLMVCSILMETSIDSIIVQNPIKFTDMRLYNSPPQDVIHDATLCKIAQVYYDLSDESQETLTAFMLARRIAAC